MAGYQVPLLVGIALVLAIALDIWLVRSGLRPLRALQGWLTFEKTLAILSIGVYAFTRFYALTDFPIYFFGDEAVQVLFAENLLTHGFRAADGPLLPIYVEAAALRWTPLISMYFHAATLTLFGKSIVVARATSAAISLLGALSVAWMLKSAFQARFWWSGILLVGVMSAWFLHSRTAFETVMTTAFYGCFLLFYLLYRSKSPRYLFPAVFFAALTFYTYSNAQLILVAAAGLLFLSDIRYHVRHWKMLLLCALVALVLALPLISFQLHHPQAVSSHLRMINSYWLQPMPLGQKVAIYAQKYVYGLSPQYWFIPNQHDLPRHRMAGIAHIPTLLLPLFLIGIALCLLRLRSPTHRAVVLAALATPVGAALVDIGIARVLAFIIPAALLIGLGLEAALGWLLRQSRLRLTFKPLSIGVFILLGGANIFLLRTALVEGPLWFKDYGLYGMQYGAGQLFEEVIPALLQKEPSATILVSSTWANGADNFIRFFLSPEQQRRVRMDGVESYLFRQLPLNRDTLFIMTAAEYQKALVSPKFSRVEVEQTIPYPDGSPGFYVTRLEYAPEAAAIFAAEKAARQQLVEAQVVYEGELLRLRHSQIDMGAPQLIFDGDEFTLMRGLEANPFILEFYFSQPRRLNGIRAVFGSVNYDVTASLFPSLGGEAIIYREQYRKATGLPALEMTFSQDLPPVSWLRLEFHNPEAGESANIHIREIKLLP